MQKDFPNIKNFDFSNVKIHSLSETRDYLLYYFEAKNNSKFSRETLDLYKEVTKIRAEDFYQLMKELNRVNVEPEYLKKAIISLSNNSNLIGLNDIINKILIQDFKGKEDLAKKIQSIIFISRIAFPFGINMKNPNMDKLFDGNVEEFSFSVNEFLSISLPTKHANPIKIIINPGIKITTVNTNNSDSKESKIKNGEGLLIGRNLQGISIFGYDFKDLILKSHLYFDSSRENDEDYKKQYITFSRAGILLVRLNDRLFLFNRGSTNSVEIKNLRRYVGISYSPDAVTFTNKDLVA